MNKINSLTVSFLKITLVPMLILGIVIAIGGSYSIGRSLNMETQESMTDYAQTVLTTLDRMYPGDYYYEEQDGEIYMFKGEHMFNGDFAYFDNLKQVNGDDISLCYMNYAVITTFFDNATNERMVGLGESEIIVSDVIEKAAPKFYSNITVNKESYFSYYVPLFDQNGAVVGMLSVARSQESVNALRRNAVIPLIILSVIVEILVGFFVYFYAGRFIGIIEKIKKYNSALAKGNFKEQLDNEVVKRQDELGQMGRDSQQMAMSLRKLVEEDQLTGLFNRRSAHKRLNETMVNYIDKGVDFALVMGDIDFFKKVNDTYGHDAGDQVLIAVAQTLKNFMAKFGYAIRWGGEEFILVYEKGASGEFAYEKMQELLDMIRALEIYSEDTLIKVTMTFGVIECEPTDKSVDLKGKEREDFIKKRIDYYINSADQKLYYGKQNGRNQIIP